MIKDKSDSGSQGYGWLLLFGILISIGIAIYYLFAFILNKYFDKKAKKSNTFILRIILTFYPFIRFLIYYIITLMSHK